MIQLLFGALLAGSTPAIDIRVDGQGLLRFARDGRAVYAKKAHLDVEGGELCAAGVPLLPEIHVPPSVKELTVDLEGNVFGATGGSRSALGQLVLALFDNESLLATDSGFLIAQDRPRLSEAGDGTAGVIRVEGEAQSKVSNREVSPTLKAAAAVTKSVVAPYREPEQRTSTALGSARIDVKANSECAGDKILLGEIATITADKSTSDKLAALDVGDAPIFGVARGIDASSIATRMRQAGFRPESISLNVPNGARVQRKAQVIPSDQFVQAAIAAAQEKAPGVTFKCDRPEGDFSAPTGKAELAVESCNLNRQSTTVTVAVYVDGKRYNSRTLVLTPDGASQGVQAGQLVKIIFRAAGATVEINGKTRTAGWVGQTVTVVADTGSIHTGTVIGPDRVEVKM